MLPINTAATSYTAIGTFSSSQIDYWKISNIAKDDRLTLSLSDVWAYQLCYLNFTVIKSAERNPGQVDFYSNTACDLLLRVMASPAPDVFDYSIASSHPITKQSVFVAWGGPITYTTTDYWSIPNVAKNELVLLGISGASDGGWESQLFYSNSTVIDSQNGWRLHIIDFYSEKDDTLQLKIRPILVGNMYYNIRSSKPIPIDGLSVWSISSDRNQAIQGETVKIKAYITNNLPTFNNQTFDVTANCGSTQISKVTVGNFSANENRVIEFLWNTTNAEVGNYQISIVISPDAPGNTQGILMSGDKISVNEKPCTPTPSPATTIPTDDDNATQQTENDPTPTPTTLPTPTNKNTKTPTQGITRQVINNDFSYFIIGLLFAQGSVMVYAIRKIIKNKGDQVFALIALVLCILIVGYGFMTTNIYVAEREFIRQATPLIADCRTIGDTNFAVQGKCFIWDIGDGFDPVVKKLPNTLVTEDLNQATILLLVSKTNTKVGAYGNTQGNTFYAKGDAYRIDAEIAVIYLPTMTPLSMHTIIGDDPPERVVNQVSAYGDITGPIYNWITSIPTS